MRTVIRLIALLGFFAHVGAHAQSGVTFTPVLPSPTLAPFQAPVQGFVASPGFNNAPSSSLIFPVLNLGASSASPEYVFGGAIQLANGAMTVVYADAFPSSCPALGNFTTNLDCALQWAVNRGYDPSTPCSGFTVMLSAGTYSSNAGVKPEQASPPTTCKGFGYNHGLSIWGAGVDKTVIQVNGLNGNGVASQNFWYQSNTNSGTAPTSATFRDFSINNSTYTLGNFGAFGISGAVHVRFENVDITNFVNTPPDGILKTTNNLWDSSVVQLGGLPASASTYENVADLLKITSNQNVSVAIVDSGSITLGPTSTTMPTGYGSVTQTLTNGITALDLSSKCSGGINWGTGSSVCSGQSTSFPAFLSPYYTANSLYSIAPNLPGKVYINPPRVVITGDNGGYIDPIAARFGYPTPPDDPLWIRSSQTSFSNAYLSHTQTDACGVEPTISPNYYTLLSFGPAWSNSTAYPQYAVVSFAGAFYQASSPNSGVSPPGGPWTPLTAPSAWSNSTPYSTGAIVSYGGIFYEATTNVPMSTPPPNPSYWSPYSVATGFAMNTTTTSGHSHSNAFTIWPVVSAIVSSSGLITGFNAIPYAGQNLQYTDSSGTTDWPTVAPYGFTISLTGATAPASLATYAPTIGADGTLTGLTPLSGTGAVYGTNSKIVLTTLINILNSTGGVARSFRSNGAGAWCPNDANVLLLDSTQNDDGLHWQSTDSNPRAVIVQNGGYNGVLALSSSYWDMLHSVYNVVGLNAQAGGIVDKYEGDTSYWHDGIIGIESYFSENGTTHYINPPGGVNGLGPNGFHYKTEWKLPAPVQGYIGSTKGNITLGNDSYQGQQLWGGYSVVDGFDGPADQGAASRTTGIDLGILYSSQTATADPGVLPFNFTPRNTTTTVSPSPSVVLPIAVAGTPYSASLTLSDITFPAWLWCTAGNPFGISTNSIAPSWNSGTGGVNNGDTGGNYIAASAAINVAGTASIGIPTQGLTICTVEDSTMVGGVLTPQFHNIKFYMPYVLSPGNAAAWSSTVNYTPQQVVYYSGLYYQTATSSSNQRPDLGYPWSPYSNIAVGTTPNVSCTGPICTLSGLTQGTPATTSFVVVGTNLASPPYHFTLVEGTLPAGLALTGEGKLVGTPTTAGSFNWTLAVQDTSASPGVGNGIVGVLSFSSTVSPMQQLQVACASSGTGWMAGSTPTCFVAAPIIASASTIAPSDFNTVTHVSGTNGIATILVPQSYSSVSSPTLTLVADGNWTITTGGNIYTASAPTIVAGHAYTATFDGSQWYIK